MNHSAVFEHYEFHHHYDIFRLRYSIIYVESTRCNLYSTKLNVFLLRRLLENRDEWIPLSRFTNGQKCCTHKGNEHIYSEHSPWVLGERRFHIVIYSSPHSVLFFFHFEWKCFLTVFTWNLDKSMWWKGITANCLPFANANATAAHFYSSEIIISRRINFAPLIPFSVSVGLVRRFEPVLVMPQCTPMLCVCTKCKMSHVVQYNPLMLLLSCATPKFALLWLVSFVFFSN